MIQVSGKLSHHFALGALLLSACRGPDTAASTRSHGSSTTLGTMLACDGPNVPIDDKGRHGEIAVTGYTLCNGLYSRDILVTFEVVNLEPKKGVFFGDRNGNLQSAIWMSDLRSHQWLSQKTTVVYLGSATNGRDVFALRQRHVGYSLSDFALRVTQGFNLQEIHF